MHFLKREVNELHNCRIGPTEPQQAEPLGDSRMLPIGATTDTRPRPNGPNGGKPFQRRSLSVCVIEDKLLTITCV